MGEAVGGAKHGRYQRGSRLWGRGQEDEDIRVGCAESGPGGSWTVG